MMGCDVVNDCDRSNKYLALKRNENIVGKTWWIKLTQLTAVASCGYNGLPRLNAKALKLTVELKRHWTSREFTTFAKPSDSNQH